MSTCWATLLQALLLLLVRLSVAAAAEDAVWRGPRREADNARRMTPVDARKAGVQALDEDEVMRCIGSKPVDRACLLHDLYYDTKRRTFFWHGDTIIKHRGAAMAQASAATFAAATCGAARIPRPWQGQACTLSAARIGWVLAPTLECEPANTGSLCVQDTIAAAVRRQRHPILSLAEP